MVGFSSEYQMECKIMFRLLYLHMHGHMYEVEHHQ